MLKNFFFSQKNKFYHFFFIHFTIYFCYILNFKAKNEREKEREREIKN